MIPAIPQTCVGISTDAIVVLHQGITKSMLTDE